MNVELGSMKDLKNQKMKFCVNFVVVCALVALGYWLRINGLPFGASFWSLLGGIVLLMFAVALNVHFGGRSTALAVIVTLVVMLIGFGLVALWASNAPTEHLGQSLFALLVIAVVLAATWLFTAEWSVVRSPEPATSDPVVVEELLVKTELTPAAPTRNRRRKATPPPA